MYLGRRRLHSLAIHTVAVMLMVRHVAPWLVVTSTARFERAHLMRSCSRTHLMCDYGPSRPPERQVDVSGRRGRWTQRPSLAASGHAADAGLRQWSDGGARPAWLLHGTRQGGRLRAAAAHYSRLAPPSRTSVRSDANEPP